MYVKFFWVESKIWQTKLQTFALKWWIQSRDRSAWEMTADNRWRWCVLTHAMCPAVQYFFIRRWCYGPKSMSVFIASFHLINRFRQLSMVTMRSRYNMHMIESCLEVLNHWGLCETWDFQSWRSTNLEIKWAMIGGSRSWNQVSSGVGIRWTQDYVCNHVNYL